MVPRPPEGWKLSAVVVVVVVGVVVAVGQATANPARPAANMGIHIVQSGLRDCCSFCIFDFKGDCGAIINIELGGDELGW